jgi:hypothetical protein
MSYFKLQPKVVFCMSEDEITGDHADPNVIYVVFDIGKLKRE